MKKAVKSAGILILSALSGFFGMLIIISLVKGVSFNVLWDKIGSVDLLRITGISILSGILMFAAVLLQIILHEGGHLVCGLATGYRFVSFRIFSFTFIRQNDKLRIKRFGLSGTGGQCLMAPPDKPLSEISTVWYNLGGVIANLLTASITLALLLSLENISIPLRLLLLFLTLGGFFLGLTNGIPLKIGGIGNDAHNMRLLLKDEKSKQALVTQLRINALIQEGMRPKEMPQEWFQMPETDYTNALQTTIKIMEASRLQDMEEWEAAYNSFEEILSHKHQIMGLLVKEITCELIFTALVTNRNNRAVQLYTPDIQFYVQQYKKVTSSKQRLLCAWALYQEKDPVRAKKIYETVCLQKEQYLMRGEVNMDLALMRQICS